MTTIIGTNRDSKCMYCNATAYGIGCPYSPNKVHVHVDDPKRCIYCGSMSFGIGCPYNPFGKIHVHGFAHNQMLKDSVENTITAGYLITKLSQPIEETQAYQLGIVNESGVKIRKPETPDERQAYTLIDAYIFKIRRALGEQLNLINSELYLNTSIHTDIDNYAKLYENKCLIKEQIKSVIHNLYTTLQNGSQMGLPINLLESIILEAFLEIGNTDETLHTDE